MRKSTAFALPAILLVAVFLRLSPLTRFLYWGADVGEYFAILRNLVDSGRVTLPYYGWGVAYPHFPGLFFPQFGLVALSGLEPAAVVSVLVPVLSAIATVVVFLMGVAISRERKAGLLAAAFVAVAMPFAYTASHAAPTTLGGLLVVTALLLFLRLRQDRRAWIPLAILTVALVMTHHLSTYFLIILVLGAILVRGLLRPAAGSPGLRRDVAYAAFLLTATFAYWFGYAPVLGLGVLRDVSLDPWWLLPVGFLLLLGAATVLVLLRRRIPWSYRPRYPGLRRVVALYVAALFAIAGFVALWVLFGVPGTSIAIPASEALFFGAFFVLLAFGASGRKFFDFFRRGVDPTAWLLAVLGSIAIGAAVAPRPLLPYRQIEYIALPIALFLGVGLPRFLDLTDAGRARRGAAAVAVGLLLAGCAAAAIPPPELLGGWQEGVRPNALDAAYWSRTFVSGLVVADHMSSTVAFGFGGVDATWDTSRTPFFAATFAESRAQLIDVVSPSGTKDAGFVWISADTRSGVTLYPWEPASPMPSAAVAKFAESPFIKVFDNGYAQLYWIAWGCDGSC